MLRVISDIHGEYAKYFPLLNCEASVQIGDLGFDYSSIPVDSNHLFFRGNHDNYNVSHPNCLGDFGEMMLGGVSFFYLRGAYSIDRDKRILGVSYWDQEEISYPTAMAAMDLYEAVKPRIVLSHDCPSCVAARMGIPVSERNATRTLLQSLFEIHQPSLWIYGHHHRDFTVELNGTEFRCLPIGGHVDLFLKIEVDDIEIDSQNLSLSTMKVMEGLLQEYRLEKASYKYGEPVWKTDPMRLECYREDSPFYAK